MSWAGVTYQSLLELTEKTSQLLSFWKKWSPEALQDDIKLKDYEQLQFSRLACIWMNSYRLNPRDRPEFSLNFRIFLLGKFVTVFRGVEEVSSFEDEIGEIVKFLKKTLLDILGRSFALPLPYPVLISIFSHLIAVKGLGNLGLVTIKLRWIEVEYMEMLHASLTGLCENLKGVMFNTELNTDNRKSSWSDKKASLSNSFKLLAQLVENASLENGREVVAGEEKQDIRYRIMVEKQQQRATSKLTFVPLQVTRNNVKSKVKDVAGLTEEEMVARVEEAQGERIKECTESGGSGVAWTPPRGHGRAAGTIGRKPRIAANFCEVADPSDRFKLLAKLVDSSSLKGGQEVIAGDEVTPTRGLEVEAFVERNRGKDEVQLQQVERRKQKKEKTDQIDIKFRNLKEQHQRATDKPVYVPLQVSKKEVKTKMKDVEGEAEEEVMQGERIKQTTVTGWNGIGITPERRKPRIAAKFGGVAPQ